MATVEPRPAATVVVARPASGSVEVLALRRAGGSRLLPGFVVFPGGSVEERDRSLAERWFGMPEEAARACAVRELAEEAALALTGSGLAVAGDRGEALRLVDRSPPAVEEIPEMARWVAPDFLPVRFDARFFSVAASPGLDPRADGGEIERAWWARPSSLLEAFHRGDVPLAWPTLKTLEALEGCRSVQDVLDLRIEQVPPPIRRRP